MFRSLTGKDPTTIRWTGGINNKEAIHLQSSQDFTSKLILMKLHSTVRYCCFDSSTCQVSKYCSDSFDDQSYTDYGFMGHPHIETPHLDKLASKALCSGAVMFLLRCADLLWQLYSPDSIRIRTR